MTIALVSDNAKTWLGLSTDTKPITSLIGSMFIELDTGKKWIWSGQAWVAYIAYDYTKAVV